MDVRLSPEQRALRDSAVQLVGRLGPSTVAALDDKERRAKLDAAIDAAGWRDLRAGDDDGQPWASAVEVAIVAEELARGVADAPFLGPTLAADLRRRAGAPAATAREVIGLRADLGGLGTATAVDAAGSSTALTLLPVDGGHALGAVALASPEIRADLTREMADAADAEPTSVPDQARVLTDDDLSAWTALGLTVT
ncbi:MAG: acyl-CoA dehydrogenase, partial [Acidimicrobiales bacterium]